MSLFVEMLETTSNGRNLTEAGRMMMMITMMIGLIMMSIMMRLMTCLIGAAGQVEEGEMSEAIVTVDATDRCRS